MHAVLKAVDDEFITDDEAAEILGMQPRGLRKLVSKGQIRRYRYDANTSHARYKLEDVLVLKASRERPINMPAVAATAAQASFNARKLERVVKKILVATGLDIPLIDLGEDSIISLYIRLREAMETKATVDEVYEWSRLFNALGEEVLEAIELYTGEKEPWNLFLRLGKKMMQEMPKGISSEPVTTRDAYCLLRHSMRHARHVAICYVQMKYGRSTAWQLFPELEGSMTEAITEMAAALYK